MQGEFEQMSPQIVPRMSQALAWDIFVSGASLNAVQSNLRTCD